MSERGHNSGIRWIALSVDARFHSIVGCGKVVEPADSSRDAWSRFEAWIDLICEASWKQRQIVNKGKTIILERGEVMAARGWLAKRWNWTDKQVRIFIEKLSRESMLSEVDPKVVTQQGQQTVLQILRQKGQQKSNLVRVISLCNYDLYQTVRELNVLLEGQRKEIDEDQTKGQQKGQQRASEGPAKGQNSTMYTNIPRTKLPRAHTRDDLDCLEEMLRGAAGDSLDVTSPTLAVLADPLRWLDGGCDLELDILPAIRSATQRKRKYSVRTWGYFNGAVLEARDRRLAPVPDVQNPVTNGSGQLRRSGDWRDIQAELDTASDRLIDKL